MFKKITFSNTHFLFPQGYSVEFRSGVNLLVGDQGCGKSTLLQTLTGESSAGKPLIDKDASTVSIHYDFERTARTSSHFESNIDLGVQVQALKASHGQACVLIMAEIFKRASKQPHTLLFDEPDTGLSIRSCRTIVRFFRHMVRQGHQVIASAHNPVLITGFDDVYSVEHRQWMHPEAFIETQMA